MKNYVEKFVICHVTLQWHKMYVVLFCDLVPFVQFKKNEKNTLGGVVLLEPVTFLKLTLLQGC